jgi:protein gp37
MKRWGEQRPVSFDEKEERTDLGEGNSIFVGSSCDMFAAGIPIAWILRTLHQCDFYNKNSYVFQSKNPARMISVLREVGHNLDKVTIGTTIETNRFYPKIMGAVAPVPEERAIALQKWWARKFVTIEPIMKFDLNDLVNVVRLSGAHWVNIGADTGNNELPEPSADEVRALLSALSAAGIEVKAKRNLDRLLRVVS